MQVKASTIVVLIFVVAAASVALTAATSVAFRPMPPDDPNPDPQTQRYQTSISVWKNGTDTILDITISCPYTRPTCTITTDVVELEIDGVSQLIRLIWWEIDETQSNWLILVNVTAPYTVDCPMDYEEFEYTTLNNGPWGSITLRYNMGEVTGKPSVRARAHMFYAMQSPGMAKEPIWVPCCPVGQLWGPWSPTVEAVPPEPFPLIEIATVIGVAGLAIGIGNNYLQGRRDRQATEVTRTAQEEERFMELYDASRAPAFQETLAEVLYQYEWTDFEEFQAKYGPVSNVQAWAKIQSLAQFFEGIGVLVEEGSVTIGRVHRLLSPQIIRCWEKLEAIILEQRKRELDPNIYDSFESLYYAIKKYQQEGPPQPDDRLVHKFE